MSSKCDGCGEKMEPVALPFVREDAQGWFLACPLCHYVYDVFDTDRYDRSIVD